MPQPPRSRPSSEGRLRFLSPSAADHLCGLRSCARRSSTARYTSSSLDQSTTKSPRNPCVRSRRLAGVRRGSWKEENQCPSQIRALPFHSRVAAVQTSSQLSRMSRCRARHRAEPARKSRDRRQSKISRHGLLRPPSGAPSDHGPRRAAGDGSHPLRWEQCEDPTMRGGSNRVSFMPSGPKICFAAYSSSDSPESRSTSAPSTTKLISL